MATQFIDAQGNLTTDISKAVTKQLRNPGLSIDTNLPGEGELFFFGGQLGVRQGGGIVDLAAAEGKNVDIGAALSQLGLRREDIPEFSLDILGGSLGQGLSLLGGKSAEFFRGFSPTTATPGVSRTEDPAAIAASLKLGAPENVAARTAARQRFQDPVTGLATDAGTGVPQGATAQGTQILNEEDLQAKREELTAVGVSEEDFSKFISSPDAQGRLFFQQPATLTSPTGEKKVVATGSQEANQLLNAGFTLGDQIGGGTIDTPLLTPETDINIGGESTPSLFESDAAAASATEDTKAIDAEIKRLLETLTPPDSELSTQVSDLLGELDPESLTGRGATQLSEEERRGIEEQTQALGDKNTELKKKLAEINTLTASFNLANVTEEGRPQTLSRLQGAQDRNFRTYIAQKNLLTSEAGFIQAEALGMQGKLRASQEAANRAVDLLYMDRESAYNAKIAQLNILLPQLEKEEARYARAVEIALNQQAAQLAEQKQAQKDVLGVMADAINAGITDGNILSQIRNAGSVGDALQILGINKPLKATGGGSNKVSTSISNSLIGGGFTESEISIIDEFVRTNGVQVALDDPDLTNDQRNAIKAAYKVPQTSLESGIEQTLKSLGWTKNQIEAYFDYTNQTGQSISPDEFKRIRPELFLSSTSSSSSSNTSLDFDNI